MSSKTIRHDAVYIGGTWVSTDHPLVDVVDPSTEEVVRQAAVATPAEVDQAVTIARRTFDDSDWRSLPKSERIAVVRRIGDALEARWPETAELLTAESGTPISAARAHGGAAAAVFRAMADVGESFQFEGHRPGYRTPATVIHEPVGVVGAITPWNGLVYLMASKLAPALIAGCTVVVKGAIETPSAAYALAEACNAAGVPPGVVSILPGDAAAGMVLTDHPGVDMIAFTGGDVAGRSIMAAASGTIKRLSLELGGKAAAIVLDDVDLESLMANLVPGSTRNTGQACGILSRVVVPRSRHDEILDELCKRVSALDIGDPYREKTVLGPLISAKHRDRVEGYIALGKDEGATVAVGGARPPDLPRGWYVQPTVLSGVDNKMRVAQEEIFGPVVCVIPYDHEDHAIAIANDSAFGLSGSVFGSDIDKARTMARRLRVGRRNVNGFGMDPGIPFGGVKQSGVGREGGIEGLRAYLETTSIFGAE
jgi:betaine-aldehyde dehydrogenase